MRQRINRNISFNPVTSARLDAHAGVPVSNRRGNRSQIVNLAVNEFLDRIESQQAPASQQQKTA